MSGVAPAQILETPVVAETANSRFARQAKLFPWLLFGPTILYLVLMSIFPLIYSLGVSLYDYTLGGDAAFIGLQSVPPQLYEAATLDRASTWMQFRRITLPYLATPILLALLFRTIDTFKIFDIVYVVTAGGPGDLTETLSVFAFYEGFKFSQLGRAAAISWLVVIVINILATVLIKMLTRQRSKTVLDEEGAVA